MKVLFTGEGKHDIGRAAFGEPFSPATGVVPILARKIVPEIDDSSRTIPQAVLRYRKQFHGTLFYAEEVRTGRRELVISSLWQQPAASQMASSTPPALPTSGTLRDATDRDESPEKYHRPGRQAVKNVSRSTQHKLLTAFQAEWSARGLCHPTHRSL